MALTDTNGNPYARLSTLEVGQKVKADDGFDCLSPSEEYIIEKDNEGFFVRCAEGHHYLDGQKDHKDKTDAIVGIYPAAI